MLTGLARATFTTLFSVSCVLACTGGGGGGGGNGAGALACRQKADSDTDSDCAGQSGKPRKLDCDGQAQTDAAVAAGCTPTKPGDSDVCCPLSVNGVPDGNTGTPDAGNNGPTCPTDYSGTWTVTGTCNVTSCNVSQTGCSSSISCDNSTSLSGTISGTTASLTGTSNGASITCTVTFTSTSAFSLACGPCTGSGSK
jgi:hypothetical protein